MLACDQTLNSQPFQMTEVDQWITSLEQAALIPRGADVFGIQEALLEVRTLSHFSTFNTKPVPVEDAYTLLTVSLGHWTLNP